MYFLHTLYLRIHVHLYQSQTHLDLFWFTVGIPSSEIENIIFAPCWMIVKEETKEKRNETKQAETNRNEKRHNRNEMKRNVTQQKRNETKQNI